MVDGAVSINNNSIFRGNIVVSAGAVNLVNTGITLDGRALTMNGAITTQGMAAAIPSGGGPAPVITAVPSFTICNGSSATLTASGGDTYSWSPGGLTTTSITVNTTTTTTYTVAATTNSITATATATVTVLASPLANAGPNVSICSAGNTTLNGTGNGTYSWNPSTGLSCTTCANPIASPTINTTYTLTVTNSCGIATSTVSVTLTTMPTANAGSPAFICSGNNTTLNGSGSGTFLWSPSTGLSCTTCANPVANPTATTTYTLAVTGSCGTNTATVSVTVNPLPVVTANANPTAVCAGSSLILTGGGAATYVWTGGVTNGIGFVPTSTNTYTVTGTNASNCSKTATITVVVNPLPSVKANASASTVCIGSSVTLTGGGAATYAWTGGVTNGIGFVPGVTSTYTVTGTNASNCSSTATVTVVVKPIPVAVAASNSPVCIGSPINLTAQTVAGGTYSWTGPNGFVSASQNPTLATATTADAGTYSLTVSNNGCTSASSIITVVINNCSVATDLSVIKTANNIHPLIGHTEVVFTITATNNGPNNATGVIVTDILQSGYTYVSSTTTAGTYNSSTGVWTIGNLNNGASAILTVTVKVIAGGNYVNTAIISGNELDLNSINDVSVIETFPTDFFIPEGFSPNGDGINDVFVIRGIFYFPDNTFEIFNRWGNKVFDATPYTNAWDGKSTMGVRVGGDELPVGTYFYILDLRDGSDVYKGTIYLNR